MVISDDGGNDFTHWQCPRFFGGDFTRLREILSSVLPWQWNRISKKESGAYLLPTCYPTHRHPNNVFPPWWRNFPHSSRDPTLNIHPTPPILPGTSPIVDITSRGYNDVHEYCTSDWQVAFSFKEVYVYTQLPRPFSKSLADLDLKEEACVGWQGWGNEGMSTVNPGFWFLINLVRIPSSNPQPCVYILVRGWHQPPRVEGGWVRLSMKNAITCCRSWIQYKRMHFYIYSSLYCTCANYNNLTTDLTM